MKAATILPLCFCVMCLCSCQSAEQKTRVRQATLEKFCTGVVKHLLDHNPKTIKESIVHLQREEIPDPLFDKLQEQGLLPKTELSILKVIDEQEGTKSSNEVQVKSVKPLGPVDKDVVPFEVSGVEIDKVSDKPVKSNPFTCKITCKFNEQTGGWPQVVDISGLKPPERPAPKVAEKAGKKKKRH